MKQKYSTYIFVFLFTTALLLNSSLDVAAQLYTKSDTTGHTPRKTEKPSLVDTRNNRPEDIKVSYKPFIPFNFNFKAENESSKVLNNVKVYPTPVTDQINLAFSLSKDIKVTIKIMDALGNEITTLFSQNLMAGEQNQGFTINGKLNSGYYFIRVTAGTETVVKRVQVL